MGILDKLAAAFSRSPRTQSTITREVRALPAPTDGAEAPSQTSMIIGGGKSTGRKTKAQTLASYADSPQVRSAVGKTASMAARVPWRAQIRNADGTWENDETHELQKLIDRPNSRMSGVDFRKTIFANYLLIGDGFVVKERSRVTGKVIELWFYPVTWLQEIDEKTQMTSFMVNGKKIAKPNADVIRIRDINPASPYGDGTGIIEALNDEVMSAELATRKIAAGIMNGATPAYLITIKNSSAEQAKQTRAAWNERNTLRSHGSVHFTDGDMTPIRLEDSFRDMDLANLRTIDSSTIRETVGLPPEITGNVTNSNRATAEAAREIAAFALVQPLLDALSDALNAYFVQPEYGDDVWLQPDDPTPASRTFELEVMRSSPSSFTINQWQELAGHEPRPDGDVLVMNVGVFAPVASTNPDDFADAKAEAERKKAAAVGEAEAETAAQPTQSARPRVSIKQGSKTPPSKREIKSVLDANSLEDEIIKQSKRTIKDAGKKSVKDFGLATDFDYDSSIANYLRNLSSSKIQDIDETTAEGIQEVLEEAYTSGQSIIDTKKDIARKFGLELNEDGALNAKQLSTRALRIAQTEMGRAANMARLDSYKQQAPGALAGKEWLGVGRFGQYRESHQDYSGTVVSLDAKFYIDGVSFDAPGMSGVADEDINCRCTVLPVVKEIEEQSADGKAHGHTPRQIQAFASWRREVVGYEMRAAKALDAQIRRQFRSVIRWLEARGE